MNVDDRSQNFSESPQNKSNNFEEPSSISEDWKDAELLHELLTKKRLPENDEESSLLESVEKIDDFQNAYMLLPIQESEQPNITYLNKKGTYFKYAIAAAITILIIGVAYVYYFNPDEVKKIPLISKQHKKDESERQDTINALKEDLISSNEIPQKPDGTTNVAHTYPTIPFLEQDLALENVSRSSGFRVIHQEDIPSGLQFGKPLRVSLLIYEDQLGHDVLFEDKLNVELWYGNNPKQPIFAETLNIKEGILKKDYSSYIQHKGYYYYRIIHDADVILLHKVLVD